MDLLMQNLKQALRDLRHHGWQAAVSAVGLAVGIVSLTFSLNGRRRTMIISVRGIRIYIC